MEADLATVFLDRGPVLFRVHAPCLDRFAWLCDDAVGLADMRAVDQLYHARAGVSPIGLARAVAARGDD